MAQIDVTYQDQFVCLPVVAVDTDGSALMGRDWLVVVPD